ncbi:Hypothetical protein HDN1F_30140 [gamma proteobacterium HdN1]|nr:Hypothetical protein HDN1F_30140 [gamma proteobacterium HdN1]
MQTTYFSLPTLPWDRFSEDERNFRVIIALAIVLFISITVTINSIDLPPRDRDQAEALPPRIAKLVTEIRLPLPEKEEPKPKPEPEVAPEPEKPAEPKAEEKPVEKPKEIPKPKVEPKPKPVAKQPAVTVQTVQQQQAVRKEQAREEATQAAQVFDALADFRDQPDVAAPFTNAQQAIGSSAIAVNDGPPAATQRNLVGKLAAGGSGGVQVAKASTGGGGAGVVGGKGRLGKVATTSVASSIGTASAISDPVRQNSGGVAASGKARRTTEQIQLIFDRYKGQIYAIYSRALREDPSLEGTLLLNLEIQPDGTVKSCRVVSSELGNAALERKIVVKVKQLNFGNANVEAWKGNFPIKFFPS